MIIENKKENVIKLNRIDLTDDYDLFVNGKKVLTGSLLDCSRYIEKMGTPNGGESINSKPQTTSMP